MATIFHETGKPVEKALCRWCREAWPLNEVSDLGRVLVPYGVAIAEGSSHSLGLQSYRESNGAIVAWGDSFWRQIDVPGPDSDFVAIAASWRHTLGIRTYLRGVERITKSV